MARTNPAEKLNRDRWRGVAKATENAIALAQRGGEPIGPGTLTALVVRPLLDALRADPAHAYLVESYSEAATPNTDQYMEFLDLAEKELPVLGVCQAFALCINPAEGIVDHYALGEMATCGPCAVFMGAPFVRHEVTAAA